MTVFVSFLAFAAFGLATLGFITLVAAGKVLLFILGVLGVLTACYVCAAGIDRAASKIFKTEPSSLLEITKAALHAACWLTFIGLGVLVFRSIFY